MTTPARTLDVTTPSDREVAITRVFDAPRAEVFDCFTRPELVSRWLLGPSGWTMPVCDIDLRVGGRIRYGWHHPERGEMAMNGTFREIVPPERIVHSEVFDEDWTGGETVVTTVFSEADGRTTVTTTVLYSSREARDAAVATGMTGGMEQGYARLDAILAERR